MESAFLILMVVAALILAAAFTGVIALMQLSVVKRRLASLERQNTQLLRAHEQTLQLVRKATHAAETPSVESTPAVPAPPPVVPAEPAKLTVAEAIPPASESDAEIADAPTPRPQVLEPPVRQRAEWSSLEVTIGSRWFNWAGVGLLVVGVMFFLKYAYDNEWIGPAGRIAIATIGGAVAMVLGERFRRASYPILFNSLTGGGLAIFYGCVYFSFQVYGLTGQTVSFGLATLVTALAVALAVVHNAPVICLLGQFGGFLSPVLLSTGANKPVELFLFVMALNLATLACAWRKQWRWVNAAGFVGTWILYAGWASRYYDESQLGVALIFSTLFYLTFLIAPLLPGLTRRLVLKDEDFALVALGILVEFMNNYGLLAADYRSWLGLAVVAQALTLAAAYAQWTRCRVEDSRTSATLLLFALALVTVAIPIQMRLYAIPIAWAVEALMLGYVGQRFRSWPVQLGALAAFVLAVGGLVDRLPLHTLLFTPVFNVPFGSWLTVTGLALALYFLFNRNKERIENNLQPAIPAVGGTALVLVCWLLHLEVAAFWTVRRDQFPETYSSSMFTSLALLWSVIPLILLRLGRAGFVRFSVPAASVAFFVGASVLISDAAAGEWLSPDIPFFNLQFLSRCGIALSVWLGLYWMKTVPDRPENWVGWTPLRNGLEVVSHLIIVLLLVVEVNSWVNSSNLFSPFMRFGFVSAGWSLHALALIGLGLASRRQFRRVLGFVLFGVTVAKVLLIDVSVLQPAYRILSFAATGALLIAAAWLYQRFAKVLLEAPVDQEA